MKKLILLAALSFATLTACQSDASYLAHVEIYDRNQHATLPVYWHNGQAYVVGQPGHEYSVKVRNRAGGDVLAVVLVDGVNAVSGETAAASQGGYVINAWQNLDVSGWRKSLDRTAAFYFTSLGDSYAARTGRPNNVGVIGVALYRRKAEPLPVYPQRLSERRDDDVRGQAQAAPQVQENSARTDRAAKDSYSAASQAPRASLGEPLGTGHGRNEWSSAQYVEFERATSYPEEVITLRYDSYENLVARGIISAPQYRQPYAPNPFPGPFVPDPR